MRVVWTPQAKGDLRSIGLHIAWDSSRAAVAVVRRIRRSAAVLRDHPGLGHPGRIVGTRELVVPRTPYLVPYRIRDDRVEILAVLHAAREWPDTL